MSEPISTHRTPAVHKPHSDPVMSPNRGATPEEVEDMLDRRDAKANSLEVAKGFTLYSFEVLKMGANRAINELDAVDVPQTDFTKHLLGLAATAVLGAATGGIAGWVVAGLSTVLKEKAASTVSGAVTAAFAKSLQKGVTQNAASVSDLKKEFARLIDLQCLAALGRFTSEWPTIKAQLASLGDSELASLNTLSTKQDASAAYTAVMQQTFVQWANFIARAKHGAMAGWDHWDAAGSRDAVPLEGAKAAPSRSAGNLDPTTGNVDPNKMGWAMENTQRPMQDEHYGMLEVFLDSRDFRLVQHSGYRMRLDNVGPNVRDELRKAGRVRDVGLNKLVRLCSSLHNGVLVDPPITIASILITADGYVRASHGFDKVHFEPKKGPIWDPMGLGDCMDNLIHGKESNECHIDKKARATTVSAVAEIAQDLPLTYLEK